jgi:Arc/MetJ-type ribon-helix-helix transcriptional regulator
MKRGFMDLVPTILENYPGLTAREVAREAIDSGIVASDAQNPEQSFATTLNKQVQTGLEKRIRRERVKGIYRYFLVSAPSTSGATEEIVVQFSLPAQELKDIDNLVAVGKYDNRSSAIKWLVLEGIKTNRAYLDKVADTKNQIERLKRNISAT